MMKQLKNFMKYTPESARKKNLTDSYNVIFLKSEDGKDWYESQADFAKDTTKIMYDENNVVRAITKDVSTFYPEGKSIIEFDHVSEEVTNDGSWEVKEGSVVKRELSLQEKIEDAKNRREKLFYNAEVIMAPLRDAITLEMATYEEEKLYKNWQKYRVLLNRVDISEPDNISWPEIPTE